MTHLFLWPKWWIRIVDKKLGSRGRHQGFKPYQTPKTFCINYDDTDNNFNFRT